MSIQVLGAVAVCAIAASAGRAWSAVAVWTFGILTPDGDEVVEPGEGAKVRVSLDISPDVGQFDPELGARIEALGAVRADVVGDAAWSLGKVSGWQMNDALTRLLGDMTRVDPSDQSVRDITGFQDCFGICDHSDPIVIIDIDWSPEGDYSPRDVSITALAVARGGFFEEDDQVSVETSESPFYAVIPAFPGTFSFQVVPGPATGALLAGAPLLLSRRRSGGRPRA